MANFIQLAISKIKNTATSLGKNVGSFINQNKFNTPTTIVQNTLRPVANKIAQVPIMSQGGAFAMGNNPGDERSVSLRDIGTSQGRQAWGKALGNTAEQTLTALPFVTPISALPKVKFSIPQAIKGMAVSSTIPAAISKLKGEPVNPINSLASAPFGLMMGFTEKVPTSRFGEIVYNENRIKKLFNEAKDVQDIKIPGFSKILTEATKLGELHLKDILKTNEMQTLKKTNPVSWIKTIATFLQDRVSQAHEGGQFPGNIVREMKGGMKTTQPPPPVQGQAGMYDVPEVKQSYKGNVYIKTGKGEVITGIPKTVQNDIFEFTQNQSNIGLDRFSKANSYLDKNGLELGRNADGYQAILKKNVAQQPLSVPTKGIVPQKEQGLELPEGLKSTVQTNLESQLRSSQTPPIIPQKGKTNLSRLELPIKGKKIISKVEESVKPTIISNKEVIKEAELAKGSVNPISDEQMKRVIANQLKNRQEVVSATRAYMKAKGSGASEKELATLMSDIVDRSRVSRQGGTMAGRLLQAQNIIADESATPMQKILALLDNAGIDKKTYMKDAVKVDWNDGAGVVNFYRKYVPPKFGEILTEIRYTNMLSSPWTHISNFATNLLQSGLIAPVEKTITGTIGKIAGKEGASPLAGARYMKGYLKSLPQAWKKFKNVTLGREVAIKPDMERIPVAGKGLLSLYTTPLKALEAGDQFFRELVGGGVTSELKGSKLSVAEIGKKGAQEADYRLFRQAFDPEGKLGQGYLLRVWDKWNTAIDGLRKVPGGNWIVPFLRTPTNILKQGVEYSPLGLGTIPGSANKIEQLSKAIIGTSVFAGLYSLLKPEDITWGLPTNAKERDAFYASGRQPYAVKVGNNWYSYQRLGPISYPIAMVAALKEAEKRNPDKNTMENVGNAMGGFMQFFADQSYVKQLGDFIDAVQTSSTSKFSSGLKAEAANVISQLVPYKSFLGWIDRMVDPVYRKAKTFGEKIKSGIPGLSQTLKPYTDENGQPSKRDFPFLNAVSPIKVSQEKSTQIDYNTLVDTNVKKQVEKRVDQSLLDSGQTEIKTEDSYKYIDESGTVKTVPLTTNIEKPKVTGIPELDKINVSAYKTDITARMKEIGVLFEKGVIDQGEAMKQIKELTAMKSGVTKPKKIALKGSLKITKSKPLPKYRLKTKLAKSVKMKARKYKFRSTL